MYLVGMPAAIELIRSGRLRALGVTSARRSEALPNTPALGEFVPGYEVRSWQRIAAPRDTPKQIIEALSREISTALTDPAFKAWLAELGGAPMPMTPVEFGKFLGNETEKWAEVIRAANIKAK